MAIDAAGGTVAAAVTAAAAVEWRLGASLCEGLFYIGVAALWLITIQWDLLDQWLGGPGVCSYLISLSSSV